MIDLQLSSKYKKDLRRCAKSGKDLDELAAAVDILRIPAQLPKEYLDHALQGDMKGYRECHIEPDWLLIYSRTDDLLYLYRTGSHSELFNK